MNSLVVFESCMFALPLFNNGCVTVACFAVVAYQRVYKPQYSYGDEFKEDKKGEALRKYGMRHTCK
jgi:hypothetical protein